MIFLYCVRAVPTPSGTVETYLISAPEPQHLREADTLTGFGITLVIIITLPLPRFRRCHRFRSCCRCPG
jgi:hypothetical protein